MAKKKIEPVKVEQDKDPVQVVLVKPAPKPKVSPVKVAPKIVAPIQPVEISLGSLNMRDEFEFRGGRYRVAEKAEDFVVANKMETRYIDDKAMWLVVGTFTFGTSTLVKKI